jgi:hypothetical protein
MSSSGERDHAVFYSAIFFDLFGTLAAPSRRSEDGEAIRLCADVLGISFHDCHHHWVTSFPERVRGSFDIVAANFARNSVDV